MYLLFRLDVDLIRPVDVQLDIGFNLAVYVGRLTPISSGILTGRLPHKEPSAGRGGRTDDPPVIGNQCGRRAGRTDLHPSI